MQFKSSSFKQKSKNYTSLWDYAFGYYIMETFKKSSYDDQEFGDYDL